MFIKQDHHRRSVIVMHNDPIWADAWDTALLYAETEAQRIAEEKNLKALLIYEGDAKLQEPMSSEPVHDVFCQECVYRYGKGRAANESQAKPPNLDKNETSKPLTGGASL